MRPSDLLGLPEGSSFNGEEAVEGTVAVVFPQRLGPHGTIQTVKIKDAPDSPPESEVTVQLRSRPPVPAEAKGRGIRIVARGRGKGCYGVVWWVRRGREGRTFPTLIVKPAALIEIGRVAPG